MFEYISTEIVYWHWLVFGLALFGIELIFPGAFFVWIGAAALVTSLTNYFLGWLIVGQVLSFILFSFVFVGLGARVYRGLEIWEAKPATLNRRGDQMVGKVIVLSDPIVNGEGHMVIGDSRWKVHGPDLQAGTEVVVVEVEGNKLIVEPY